MPGELVELERTAEDKNFLAVDRGKAIRCVLKGEVIAGVLVAVVQWSDLDEAFKKKVINELEGDLFDEEIQYPSDDQRIYVVYVTANDARDVDDTNFWLFRVIVVPKGPTYAKVKLWNPHPCS